MSLPKLKIVLKTKSKETPVAKRNTEAGVNDPWIGIDSKANMTRVAENSFNKRKEELAKSARIIKALYKNKKMVESKNPVLQDTKNKSFKNVAAAAVLIGGKTLTGKDRDVIEIDPEARVPKIGNSKDNRKIKNK